jgi:hypothetical protein
MSPLAGGPDSLLSQPLETGEAGKRGGEQITPLTAERSGASRPLVRRSAAGGRQKKKRDAETRSRSKQPLKSD